MTNSFQPPDSSKDLFNDILISSGATGANTITITGAAGSNIDNIYIDTSTMNTSYYSVTGTGGYTTLTDTITVSGDYKFNWGEAQEFVDSFPSWQRVQDMCKKYPGLEIALRNFQTVYTLVKDDYDNPKDEK